MFIPINTDAPLYHRPIGTIGLIAANIGTFAITHGGTVTHGWLLTFGNGLHPSEWVASAFLHFGLAHLIGNMIFLWAFGLIIEGKIGTLRLLGLYFALCLIGGWFAQFVMLNPMNHFRPWGIPIVRGAGGASGVIFSMMVISLLWAPRNSFDVIWFFRLGYWGRGNVCEISVISLSIYYLGLNLLQAWFYGFSMSTPVLHLMGGCVGLPLGLMFLKFRWVDCEGWDLISLWKKEIPTPWDFASRRAPEVPVGRARSLNPSDRMTKLRNLIDQGRWEAAFGVYRDLNRFGFAHPIDSRRLRKFIDGLAHIQQWREAAELLEAEYLPLNPEDGVRAKLMLAGILVRELARPRAALRILKPLSAINLSESERDLLHRIEAAAEQQVIEGVMEISPEPLAPPGFRIGLSPVANGRTEIRRDSSTTHSADAAER